MEHTILKIFENGIEKSFKKIDIIKMKHKFSNTGVDTYRIVIDGVLVKKEDKLQATYRCEACNNVVGPYRIQNYTRRLRNKTKRCDLCREDEEKCLKHSEFMYGKTHEFFRTRTVRPKKSMLDLISESYQKFDKETQSFKDLYYTYHFTEKDFSDRRSNIISVDDIPYTDDWVYVPAIIIHNNQKYAPRLYDPNTETLIRPVKMLYVCSKCNNTHRAKYLSGKRNKCCFLCRYCFLVTERFCIRVAKNINNDKITYQSGLEYTFIEWCKDHSILVTNGPILCYSWNNNDKRRYNVDFQVDNILIELKDMHIWHLKQVESGKWAAKENAAIEYCKNNGMEFRLIFPDDLDDFKLYLRRYSPTLGETQGSKV